MESLPKHPKQAEVIIYSKEYCSYCVAAKNFLTQKGVAYTEIDMTGNEALQKEVFDKAYPRRTVPQIFVNQEVVGGYDDIKRLDHEGKLMALLFPAGK